MKKTLLTEWMAHESRVSFHTPGHKGGAGAPACLTKLWGTKVFEGDVTEVRNLDNLAHPEGVLKASEERAARVFGAGASFFLVNGSTAGNLTLMTAFLKPGDQVLVDRNAHRSLWSALVATDCEPIFIRNRMDVHSGCSLGLDEDYLLEMMNRYPNAKALFVTHPTYDGVCQNLPKLREMTAARGMKLLVDEAHGAHLYFLKDKLPCAATTEADGWVNSTHKTLGSLTQSSLLHIRDKAFIPKIQEALNLYQTSSPSYLLMTSLDAMVEEMEEQGSTLALDALKKARDFGSLMQSLPDFELFNWDYFKKQHCLFDDTKVLLSARSLGYTGEELQKILEKKGIDGEKCDTIKIVLLFSHGTLEKNYKKVYNLLKCIKKRAPLQKPYLPDFYPLEQGMKPRDAFYAEKEIFPLSEALGRTAGIIVAPEPPGIPLVGPGEKITEPLIDTLTQLGYETITTIKGI